MSRSLSALCRQALYAEGTEQVFLLLLTISHGDLAAPIRVVNNTVSIVSRSQTFVAYPFEIDLPGESAEQLASVQLRIDNVDRAIVDSLRQLLAPPSVLLEVVLASQPDVVEASFALTLASADYDALVVTATLRFEDILSEPFPAGSFLPGNFPGLF